MRQGGRGPSYTWSGTEEILVKGRQLGQVQIIDINPRWDIEMKERIESLRTTLQNYKLFAIGLKIDIST